MSTKNLTEFIMRVKTSPGRFVEYYIDAKTKKGAKRILRNICLKELEEQLENVTITTSAEIQENIKNNAKEIMNLLKKV